MLVALSAAPVLANDEPRVIMQGSGQVVFGEDDAIFTIHINTAANAVRMSAIIPGGTTMPEPDGQRITGLYWEGEVTFWEIADDTVTVDCLIEAYLLPSHEPFPGIGAYEVQIEGVLTGPGNRGEIILDGLTIPGTIIIR